MRETLCIGEGDWGVRGADVGADVRADGGDEGGVEVGQRYVFGKGWKVGTR
jgi:hypothetical protein